MRARIVDGFVLQPNDHGGIEIFRADGTSVTMAELVPQLGNEYWIVVIVRDKIEKKECHSPIITRKVLQTALEMLPKEPA
jgi:hypothetical protein